MCRFELVCFNWHIVIFSPKLCKMMCSWVAILDCLLGKLVAHQVDLYPILLASVHVFINSLFSRLELDNVGIFVFFFFCKGVISLLEKASSMWVADSS